MRPPGLYYGPDSNWYRNHSYKVGIGEFKSPLAYRKGKKMKVLFKTIHGSHLYGLAHEFSDLDYYTVVAPVKRKKYKYAKQSIVDNVDNVTVDLGTWLRLCDKGVPQALEAMFSRMPEYDELSELRNSYRIGSTNMRDTYYRTMENFVQSGDFKRKRHALRLYLNLKQALKYGRFNPTLGEHQRWWTEQVATRFSDESVLGLVLSNRYDSNNVP